MIALATIGGTGAILADGPCGARLAEAGRTDYTIVVPACASACDRFAAEELRRFLGESTGADFPIVAEGEAQNRKTFELGTARARQIVVEAQVASLREEACRYKIAADGTYEAFNEERRRARQPPPHRFRGACARGDRDDQR